MVNGNGNGIAIGLLSVRMLAAAIAAEPNELRIGVLRGGRHEILMTILT